MAANLHDEPLVFIAEAIRRRQVSAVEVTTAMLDRIEALDGEIRSYTTVTAEHALAAAARADCETARGISRGPLHGVPLGIKDLCDTRFAPTGAGTVVHRERVPDSDATVVERLEQGGAVILGKLAMTEGAYTSHHPDNPGPLNPWGRGYWLGSSSTGSGAATAARLCFGSLGSDTGGSIRFPSATCGLTGIKPSWGRVSRHGVFPLATSLDHVGPMARSAADAAAILGVIAGADRYDPTALAAPVDDYLGGLGRSIRGLTIGIDRRFTTEGIDAAVVAALDAMEAVLRGLGARLVEVAMPPTDRLVRGWIPFCSVETALAHRETYPARAAEYGPDLAGLIDQGRSVPGLDFGAIYHDRLDFSGALAALFAEVDLLLVPTMPMPVPSLARMGEYGKDPEVLLRLLRFTAPFNFSGSPTITLPAGIDAAGLPLSVQLVGPHLSEALLCRAGHAVQQVTDWHARRPLDLA
ncbi:MULTISPECIES: amidase [Methylobacterium]|uniref:amidase n=1 Tax=Methylobacterium TaxID=407 RepID=UPI0013EA7555|nr:amidase [Methylobacterium sp. DB0501]NGM37416.1 amidase [Methylobacterium sp. DB0501]